METSTTTSAIFSAVAKMQAELTNATKAKQGHGYKYADLAQCLEVAKEPLAKNGLAVVQLLGMSTNNETTLITMLTHESGEYIRSEFVMERAVLQGGAGKNPAQNMGASITYMRRYAFAAILGMAQEDDDAANNGKKPKPEPKTPRHTPPPQPRKLPEELAHLLDIAGDVESLGDIYRANLQKAQDMGYEKEFNIATNNRKKQLQQGAF